MRGRVALALAALFAGAAALSLPWTPYGPALVAAAVAASFLADLATVAIDPRVRR